MGGSMKVLAGALKPQGKPEVSTERHVGMGLGDLPEACIAVILAFTSPLDVARLACASRTFRDASRSDAVWQKMLPARYEEIIAQVPSWPRGNPSRRDIYDFLCSGCFLEKDTQEYWLDKASGGVCRSVGARGLRIVWEENPRYWTWISREGSRYIEVAHLKSVCWLEARGNLQCHLPPGEYVVSWRVYMAFRRSSAASAVGRSIEWGFKPVKFTLEANGQFVNTECYLTADGKGRSRDYRNAETSSRMGYHDSWMDIGVGTFTVEEGDSAVDLSFSMSEIEGGNWKSGLSLDCVLIRPAFVRETEGRQQQWRAAEERAQQQHLQGHHAEEDAEEEPDYWNTMEESGSEDDDLRNRRYPQAAPVPAQRRWPPRRLLRRSTSRNR